MHTLNDLNRETYSRRESWGEYNPETAEASVGLILPDYFQGGTYSLNYILMKDVALNAQGVYFTDPRHALRDEQEVLDELPATIDIVTTNPDSTPPVLDLNRITIKAKPTNPAAPNGETRVDITFRIKDDISGYSNSDYAFTAIHRVSRIVFGIGFQMLIITKSILMGIRLFIRRTTKILSCQLAVSPAHGGLLK